MDFTSALAHTADRALNTQPKEQDKPHHVQPAKSRSSCCPASWFRLPRLSRPLIRTRLPERWNSRLLTCIQTIGRVLLPARAVNQQQKSKRRNFATSAIH